jgi:hypothetical protein
MSEAVQDPVNTVAEPHTSELTERRWSVISFERCEASAVSYPDAQALMDELEKRGIAGLCIVADEAAARLAA